MSKQMEQSLFPLLPDVIGLDIVVRLGLKERLVAQRVNPHWRSVLRSKDFYEERATREFHEDHLCVCYNSLAIDGTSMVVVVKLFNPKTGLWFSLPPLQVTDSDDELSDFVCLSYGPNLFILGGLIRFSKQASMWIFDALKGNWEEGPSMTIPRSGFVAGIINDCLYVADDETLAEVEVLNLKGDLKLNGWVPIHQVNVNHSLKTQGSFVKNGKLYLVKGAQEDDKMEIRPNFDVFDPIKVTWVQEPGYFKLGDSHQCFVCHSCFAVVGNQIYGVFHRRGPYEEGEAQYAVRFLDESEGRWKVALEYSPDDWPEFFESCSELVAVSDLLFVVCKGYIDATRDYPISKIKVLELKYRTENTAWELKRLPILEEENEMVSICCITNFTI